ncbi:MAG: hypothetical protein M3328_16095 [Chloroflexota bacterium]|nr:hypothetical protein [Chloroflexota bacterium]
MKLFFSPDYPLGLLYERHKAGLGLLALVLVCAGLFLVGRGSNGREALPSLHAQTETPTLTPMSPTPAATPIVFADCIWAADARAFVDENANQSWDTTEIPLAGVNFYVDDTLNNFDKVSDGVSDKTGYAMLSVWLPGCPDVEFEVYTEVPEGYTLTTPGRIKALDLASEEPFTFGFRAAGPPPGSRSVPGMPGTGRLDDSAAPESP